MIDHQEIVLLGASADDGIKWCKELIAAGLVNNRDFYWSYTPAEYDWLKVETVRTKSVSFFFRDAHLATYYKLKWQN